MIYGISPTEKTELLRDDEMRRVRDFMSEKGGDFGIALTGQRTLCLSYHSGTNKARLQYPLWNYRHLYFRFNTDIRPKAVALRAAGRKSPLSPLICSIFKYDDTPFPPIPLPTHSVTYSLKHHIDTRTP